MVSANLPQWNESAPPLLVVQPNVTIIDILMVTLMDALLKGITWAWYGGLSMFMAVYTWNTFVFPENPFSLHVIWQTGALCWVVAVGVYTVFHFVKIQKMAHQTEYRFYSDYYAYTVGDGKVVHVPYASVERVAVKEELQHRQSDLGTIYLFLKKSSPQEQFPLAMRKIVNIHRASSVAQQIQELVEKSHTRTNVPASNPSSH